MRVQHPAPVRVECATYACTLERDDHEPVDDPNFDHAPGDVWHHDDSTGVWWPARDERINTGSTGEEQSCETCGRFPDSRPSHPHEHPGTWIDSTGPDT